ncbi:MAG TPA: hypothetical protein VFR61_07835 [Nitrososphaeraceae archaeon]|jgi:hypothetical protein|nr:hypothetical protein [Nitrososphaeraceae archaeon]
MEFREKQGEKISGESWLMRELWNTGKIFVNSRQSNLTKGTTGMVFLSCYKCGNTFGIHETHFDSKIKDSVQTTSNPFDNESEFLSTDNRATQRKKNKGRTKSKRFRQNEK